jgi:potassium efflux system protein
LSQLETDRANESAIEEYRLAAETAPVQTKKLRAQAAPENIPAPLADLPLSQPTPLEELVALLEKEQADLGAVTARTRDFQARLAHNEGRPTAINQRLAEATGQREAVSARLQLPPADGISTALLKAQHWALETGYQALSTEIKLLDPELLTRSARMKLLEAKRDRKHARIAWITTRVNALNELVDLKRQEDADQARIEAERAQRATADMDPLLGCLSESNAALSQEVNAIAGQLQALDSKLAQVSQLIARIDADYADARETVESKELSGELGAVRLEQRRALPELLAIKQGREQRQTLVGDALEAHELYLAKQRELDAAEDQLLAAAVEYEDFLVENVLWLRSEEPTSVDDLLGLPSEVRSMLTTADLRGLTNTALRQLSRSPAFWLAAMLAVALRWRRGALLKRIDTIANRVGKPTTDGFDLTLRTLGLTLLIAAPLPLAMAVSGLHLTLPDASTELPRAVGDSLLRIGLILYTLLALAAICLPRGLARAHFRWPESNITLLRSSLTWLIWLFPTLGLAFHLALDLNPAATGGAPARLIALPLYIALVWFLFRLFHPRRGVLTQARQSNAYPLLMRTYWLWYLATEASMFARTVRQRRHVIHPQPGAQTARYNR